MDWSLWLRALLLVFMLEGMIMAVMPEKYQFMARQVSTVEPGVLRVFGFCMMTASLFLTWLLV